MSEVTCVSLGDGTQIEFDTNIECLGGKIYYSILQRDLLMCAL